MNVVDLLCHEIKTISDDVTRVYVYYTAAFAVRVASYNTDRLCIVFHPLVPDWAQQLALIKRIREVLVKKAGVNPAWVIPVDRGDIPKTAIGKIQDRKSTRLNSSHRTISYAVFCLKKKKKIKT